MRHPNWTPPAPAPGCPSLAASGGGEPHPDRGGDGVEDVGDSGDGGGDAGHRIDRQHEIGFEIHERTQAREQKLGAAADMAALRGSPFISWSAAISHLGHSIQGPSGSTH